MNESIGEWVDISALEPWKDNPRQNQSAIDEVAKSIKRFGFASPIIARAADKMIIAGHTRFEAAKKIGLKSVPVRFMDLDLNDAQLLALADNKIGEIADWDEDKLKDILASLDDQDLSGLGWSDEELDALIDQDDPVELNGDPDDVPEVEEQAITSAGDLWLLGDHRLLCGDSTKEEDVGRLMAGEKADMVFTDPPYGIDVVNKSGTIGGSSKSQNGNIVETQKYRPVIGDDKEFDPSFILKLFESSKIILWGSNYFCNKLPIGGRWLVWDKNRGEGTTFSDCELAWTNIDGVVVKKYKVTWDGMRREGESSKRVHPTQKPILLCSKILDDYSETKIVDLFGGSGSTLIACEQTNRKCFMMELDPKYCDVIIRRWQQLTGKEAIKEDGIKFNDIADIPW